VFSVCLSDKAPDIYFPFLRANLDGVDHVRLFGDNTFGFEEMAGGGDQDFDDAIVPVEDDAIVQVEFA
jgi:hypothetical protein